MSSQGGVTNGPAPDPRDARTLDDLLHQLRLTRSWAGSPSYQEIARRVNAARARSGSDEFQRVPRSTVADQFTRSSRQRLNYDLVFEILRALGLTERSLRWWRETWQAVLSPPDPATTADASADLPEAAAYFTGRRELVARLVGLVTDRDPAGPVVAAVEGMPGVGKTQLAIRVGRELIAAGRFPDVQLFMNLRGFDSDRPPVAPDEALRSLLRALGVAGNRVPRTLGERVAMYRQLLRDKRALIVLDNAADAEQVAPLLPAGGECLALVTSRHRLAELTTATHVPLDVFSPDEAATLLAALVGDERVRTEPDAAARIAQSCGRLPLSLVLVARDISARPDWSLADHMVRLATLGVQNGVRAAFQLSYSGLPDHLRLAVRRCALHPGHDLTAATVAALADGTVPDAERWLRDLVAGHLLQARAPGRYEFHDLIRECATERLFDEEPSTTHQRALTRLLDHYRNTAAAAAIAMDLWTPSGEEWATAVNPFDDRAPAAAWLDDERANIVATAARAADQGWPEHVCDLAAVLHRYLDAGGHLREAETLYAGALRVAGDDRRGMLLSHLGSVYWRLGRYEDVLGLLRQVGTLSRRAGDQIGQARALINSGVVYWRIGRYTEALEHHQRGLDMADGTGEQGVLCAAHNNLGTVHFRLGHYEQAREHQQRALDISRAMGNQAMECKLLNNVAIVYERLGLLSEAQDVLRQALTAAGELGDRETESTGLDNLGIVYRRLGRYPDAVRCQRQALAILRESGNQDGEAAVLNDLGDTLRHLDERAEALACHRDALAGAEESGNRYEQGRAHAGIARGTADEDLRRTHAEAAHAIFTELGVPEQQEILAG